MERFEVTTSTADGVATVVLEGELDISTAPVPVSYTHLTLPTTERV